MSTYWVEKAVEEMTVEEKVGQLLMVAFFTWDQSYITAFQERLKSINAGGVFHFTAPERSIADFVHQLQANARYPMLVASDYEMGAGWIIPEAVRFQRPMARGFAGTAESEYQIAKIIARQGRGVGTNMTFSPVVDVNTHPLCPDVNTRAYSDNQDRVASLAAGFVNGLQDNGMLGTLKHFPGNGGTMLDQHITPAYNGAGKEEFNTVYLKPYRELMASVSPAAIMVAHLEIPSLCSEVHPVTGRVVPASLSHEIINGLLKTELNFQGMVITDATNMGGINNIYSREEAVIKTIQAGSDMILDFYPDDFENDYYALLRAVETGQISESRLHDALRRVLTAKWNVGLANDNGIPADEKERKAVFESTQYQPLLDQISEQGITVLKNKKSLLPMTSGLSGKKAAILQVYSPEKKVMKDQGQSMPDDVFASEIRKRGAAVTEHDIVSTLSMDEIQAIFNSLKGYDVVFMNFYIVPSWGIGSLMPNLNATRLFYQGLLTQNDHVIISCFGDPYVTAQFITAHTILCTFDESEVSQRIAVEAILGERRINGRMPVSMDGFFKYGDGTGLPS